MKTSMSESLFSSMAMATGYNEEGDDIAPSSVRLDGDDEVRARTSFEINFINDGQRRWAKRTKRRERRPKARLRKSEERPIKVWMEGGGDVGCEPAL